MVQTSLLRETPVFMPPAKRRIEFTFTGIPQPQGSKRAFTPKGWSRPIIVDSNPNLQQWRTLVSEAAHEAMSRQGALMIDGPVRLTLTFAFVRPKSAPKRVVHHTTKPDALKCGRAVEDSLSKVVYRDDSQVVELVVRKQYGEPPGVSVIVEEL